MAAWRLELLGGFRFLRDGKAVTLASRKDRLLLALLALQDGAPLARDRMAGMLWTNRPEEQARTSLRQSLTGLRTVLGEDSAELISAGRESVTLTSGGTLAVDALEFRQRLSRADCGLAALALYRGPLLFGLDTPSPEYEEWLRPERQALEEAAARLLDQLSARELDADGVAIVLARAREMIRLDPLCEAATRAGMRLLIRLGERTEAARLYQACATALAAELGVLPEEATQALYRTLRQEAPQVPPPPLAERPTLVVMPLQNISGTPALATLCEGLAEDITAALGRFRQFSVIDRHSARTVASLTSDAREIGGKLGADLVIQGSLQRGAAGYRLGVRLIEAETRVQRWAGDFNVTEADVLQAPHRIMAAVLPSIRMQAETSLIARSRRRTVLAAYEHLLLGVKHLRGYEPDDNQRAVDHFDRALAIDPDFALALAYRAFADVVLHGYDGASREILESSARRIRRAAEMDPDEPRIWWLLGMTVSYMGDSAAEETFYRRAHELNPNEADVLTALALVTISKGKKAEGLAMMEEAFRLNPFRPEWYWVDYGSALYLCEKYKEALAAFSRRLSPNVWVLTRMAACHVQLGQMEEARNLVSRALALRPDFRISHQRPGRWWAADAVRFREALIRAGLPE